MTCIQEKLRAWGDGLAMDSAPNGYPSRSAFAKVIAQGSIKIPPLGVDEQTYIDAVVSRMKHQKPMHYEVICYHYIAKLADGQIAQKVKKSRTWVRETRIAGEHYIEGQIT